MKTPPKKKVGGRNIPESYKDERGIIASIMQDPTYCLTLCIEKGITPSHFFHENMRLLFECILILWSESKGKEASKVNLISLTSRLRDRDELAKCGGAGEVTSVSIELPTAANCEYYLEAVIEKHTRRLAIAAYDKGQTAAYTELEKPVAEIIAETGTALVSVIARKNVESVTKEAIAKVREQIRLREGGSINVPLGLPTGVPGWISSLCGVFEGTMYVIAGRPGMAKTALIEQMMDTQIQAGINILCIEKDMPVQTLIGRMAARRANISYDKFLTGGSSADDLDYMKGSLEDLERDAKFLHLYDTAGMTADNLDSLVRAEKNRHDVKAFYLDHFLNLRVDRSHGGQLVEGLTMGSATLRRCITETGVAGIVLVHINRDGADGKPRPENIKYCDGLLADSDVTGLLWSTVDPKTLGPNVVQEITLSIDKNRNGAVSEEKMYFHRERTTFVEV